MNLSRVISIMPKIVLTSTIMRMTPKTGEEDEGFDNPWMIFIKLTNPGWTNHPSRKSLEKCFKSDYMLVAAKVAYKYEQERILSQMSGFDKAVSKFLRESR